MATTVRPRTSARTSTSRPTDAGSRPAVASSRSSTRGSTASSAASATRFFSPPGELERRPVEEVRHLERLRPARDAAVHVGEPELARAERDLVRHRRVEEHRVDVLEEEPDLAAEPPAERGVVERRRRERPSPRSGPRPRPGRPGRRGAVSSVVFPQPFTPRTTTRSPAATAKVTSRARSRPPARTRSPAGQRGEIGIRTPASACASATSRAFRAERTRSVRGDRRPRSAPPRGRAGAAAAGCGARARDSVASSRSAWICARVTTRRRVAPGQGSSGAEQVDPGEHREGDEGDERRSGGRARANGSTAGGAGAPRTRNRPGRRARAPSRDGDDRADRAAERSRTAPAPEERASAATAAAASARRSVIAEIAKAAASQAARRARLLRGSRSTPRSFAFRRSDSANTV